jgi:hypothetical protein
MLKTTFSIRRVSLMSEHAHAQDSDLPSRDWVAFIGSPLGFTDAVVCRLAEVDGRVRIVELRISGGEEPIAAAALRQLPLSAMERVAGTVLRVTDANAESKTVEVLWSLDSLSELLKDAPAPLSSDSKLPGPPLIALYGRGVNGQLTYVMKHDPPIDWSKGQAITDEFLRSVGGAYDAAIQRGESPAKSIAEATGASQKTVQSWVYQGRRRGVIAPAQGKGRIK